MYQGSTIIALCIPKAYEHTDFISELNDLLLQYGYRMVIYHTCSDLYWHGEVDRVEKAVFTLIDFNVIDAIIIYEELFFDKNEVEKIMSLAERHDKPIVTIGAGDDRHISVIFDYEQGFELVARHVVEEHHITHPHFIAGVKGEYHSECRIGAFKKVLAENNISFSEDMVSYGDYWHEPTKNALMSLMAREEMPDAILCVNDSTAITVCNELQCHGMNVPEDIIVTGFDGTKAAKYFTPPITTCHYNMSLLVREIVKNIHQALEGEDKNGIYEVDFLLDIFSSCGCRNEMLPSNFGHMARAAEDAFNGYFETQRMLYELTEKTVMCNDAREIAERLDEFHFDHCIVFLNQKYFDNAINPLDADIGWNYDDGICVTYTPNEEEIPLFSTYGKDDFMPFWDVVIRNNHPTVLTALGFRGNPLGFSVNYPVIAEPEYRKINQYISSINVMLGCNQNVRYIKYTAKYMEEVAKHDAMTKLYNRNGFYEALVSLVRRAKASKSILAVVSVDADNLKYVNDTFGHENGDIVICAAADALSQLDYSDAIYGRFGGDEFAACIVAGGDIDESQIIAGIKGHLDAFNQGSRLPFAISVSVGVQLCPAKNFDFDFNYKKADMKMYEDKKTKRKKT